MRGYVGWLAAAIVVVGAAMGGQARAEAAKAGQVEIVIEPSSESPEGSATKLGDVAAKAKDKSGVKKPAVGEPPVDEAEHMKQTFADFCAGWIEKLRERERYNLSKITWETAPDGGVFGEYVGYDTVNPGPQTVGNVDTTPIGKLVYMEFRLRRSGKSREEALAGEPEVVDRIEVTEIFRFDRDAWVY
jgi:hypothetical protein